MHDNSWQETILWLKNNINRKHEKANEKKGRRGCRHHRAQLDLINVWCLLACSFATSEFWYIWAIYQSIPIYFFFSTYSCLPNKKQQQSPISGCCLERKKRISIFNFYLNEIIIRYGNRQYVWKFSRIFLFYTGNIFFFYNTIS